MFDASLSIALALSAAMEERRRLLSEGLMIRKSVLNADGLVVNVVALVEGSAWVPPDGETIGPDGGEIGDTWDGAQYIKPPAE